MDSIPRDPRIPNDNDDPQRDHHHHHQNMLMSSSQPHDRNSLYNDISAPSNNGHDTQGAHGTYNDLSNGNYSQTVGMPLVQQHVDNSNPASSLNNGNDGTSSFASSYQNTIDGSGAFDRNVNYSMNVGMLNSKTRGTDEIMSTVNANSSMRNNAKESAADDDELFSDDEHQQQQQQRDNMPSSSAVSKRVSRWDNHSWDGNHLSNTDNFQKPSTFQPPDTFNQSSQQLILPANNQQQQTSHPTQQQQQQRTGPPQNHIIDSHYTQSLHWENPQSQSITKRQAVLPTDVTHIEDVEWAGDEPKDNNSNKTVNTHPLHISNLEKAPRPKYIRHEPCFCQPDLTNETPSCVDETCALFACQEECPANCPCGALCRNKRIQRKEWKKLTVFDAGLKGRGLMLDVNGSGAKKGDFIVEYVGVAIKRRYLDSVFARYKSERMLYIMALDGDVYIDARYRGGIARYINHSCKPNCEVHRWKVRGIIRAGIFATRDIMPGEELSFDYQWERKRGRAFTKCYCGSENCRGTLEEAKGDRQRELEEQLEGHWVEPRAGVRPGREIMNRVVKVWFEDNEEYYVADVSQFDAVSGQHQLMYRDHLDDCWTDMSKEKWMLLDEEGEKYAIARKIRDDVDGDSLLAPPMSHSTATSPRSDSMSRSSSPLLGSSGVRTKNYIYIQTPIKDGMQTRHTLYKCEQFCRVHIDVTHLTEVKDDDEDDMKRAMAESQDGTIWKLVVAGEKVKKAVEYLEKMVSIIGNSLKTDDDAPEGVSTANLSDAASAQSHSHKSEMIFPRVILDQVRKKFFSLKGYCYGCEIDFTHSDSKSKQFAKFTISANLGSDLERSLEYLNGEITQLCLEADAPKTNVGVYKDLGYLGGEMSNEDFRLLFHSKHTAPASTDCSEDLKGSVFAASFEEANKCSIWVQAEEDMGRVEKHQVKYEFNPNHPRKIFFGVTPSRANTLWQHLLTRINDLKRGVHFLNLGKDRIYQPILLRPMKKHGQPGSNYFFDFVQNTSKANVRIDSITGNHLRIDGGDGSLSEHAYREVDERVNIATEMIRLQIELLRDHHIRQQRWGFGRDWALLLTSDSSTLNQIDPSSTQDLASLNKVPASHNVRSLDDRALGFACLEISEIVSSAGLSDRVAAHACIIFYRYTSLPSNTNALNTNFKLRDVQLASLFIANKSQKVMKWKRLETVLEHSYRVFYPGSVFNPESEEAKNWERRVITAEKAVLLSLDYDVFWSDVDWVTNAVVGTNAMAEPIAENTMSLALSSHVLAAGPVLWLKYGPKYAFAAIAGYLSLDLEKIFHALSLVPVTVSHAAELIYNSCQALSKAKKSVSHQSSKHEIFNDITMKANYHKIQSDCAAYMSKYAGQIFSDSNFVASPEYKAISHRSRLRRVFEGVRSDIVEENILPQLGKISFESNCNIRFSECALEGAHDVVLEGNWKALAIAEHLFSLAAKSTTSPSSTCHAPNSHHALSNSTNSFVAQDYNLPTDGDGIKQVKVQSGLLGMKNVSDRFGWYGTVECATEYSSSEVYDAGYKTCIAAQASQEHLDAAGLRWWVPNQYGPSLDGSLCEILSSPKVLDNGSVDMRALALLAQSFTGGYASLRSNFPTLASHLPPSEEHDIKRDSHSIAISLTRWPPEKIEMKEQSGSSQNMQMGFSVAALQEMQLLHQLHILIPSPKGHPNFILPLAIALESDADADHDNSSSLGGAKSNDATEQILAMIERNQKVAGKKHRAASGSHLVLEPTPLVLQKVIHRYQRKNNSSSLIPPTVLASLCHDILSAISFCHSNHIILRSLLPDQIHIDHCGTAKLSGLSKVMVLHGKDRTKEFNPLKYVRDKRKSRDHSTEDVEPFAAPELLLGGNRHTKESDMWAFGALIANLLLGKQLFPGKDRVSKMTQVFKIVGVPTEENYPEAKRFPFYSNNMYVIGEDNKKKRYPRGVVKALRSLLKPFDDKIDDYSDLMSLLDGILHLDPKQRMTADEALRHSYMARHLSLVQDQEFRQCYVKDWLELKENILTKGGKASSQNSRNGAKDVKRKAVSFGEPPSHMDNDLYNIDDNNLSSSSKRQKNFDP
eukprot:scaffold313154_cov96-Cyclotella_meneghiniana.AAC.3